MRILVSAAERSGDLHAANLVREVLRRDPSIRFEGFGGELLRGAGCEVVDDLVSIASMGFGFLRHVSRYVGIVRRFQRLLSESRPAAVVLVDSPGLNFILARLARWRGVPVVDYILPQIWAWAPWRRARILRNTDLLLAILPFETELYSNPRVPVRYVGHPIVDELAKVPPDAGAKLRAQVGIEPRERVVGILPGSRRSEIQGLMPVFGRVLEGLRARGQSCQVLVSCFRPETRTAIHHGLRASPFPFSVLEGDARPILQASDLLLVASGTASLEAAFFGNPTIVAYPVSGFEHFLSRVLLTTPYFALPNILGAHLLGGEAVVPERVIRRDEPGDMVGLAGDLLRDGPAREDAIRRLRALREGLFRPGAPGRAAEALLEFLAARARDR